MLPLKVKNKKEFCINQFLILETIKDMKSKRNEEAEIQELSQCEEYAYILLLLCGAKALIKDNVLIFSSDEQTVDRTHEVDLSVFDKYPFLEEAIQQIRTHQEEKNVPDIEIKNEEAVNENTKIDAINDNEEEISSNTAEKVIADKEVSVEIPDPIEEVISSPTDNLGLVIIEECIEEEKEEKDDGLLFGKFIKETEDMPHAESMNEKYLDTMWFHKFHIICSEKDGYVPEEFELTIYPLEITRERVPVQIAVALKHGNLYKIAFSSKEKPSLEMNYDNYIFAITTRFVETKLVTKISLCSDYEIQDIQETHVQSESIMPLSFGKKVTFGQEEIEIYPLELNNDEKSGCVPFMYRYLMKDENAIIGTSDDDCNAVLALKENGAKSFYCYWMGQNEERKLIVNWD